MKAFLYGISLQFRLDLRSKSLLITCYLVPLLFFAVMGGIFSSLMPEARETLTQSMTIMGISMGAFIGVPPTILEMYERDMRKTYAANGVPLFFGLFAAGISAFLHLAILSVLLFFASPLAFGAKFPPDIPFYFFTMALCILVSLCVACALGLAVKNQAKLTMCCQLVFLPSILLSGILFPSGLLPGFLQALGKLFPAYWAYSLLCGTEAGIPAFLPLGAISAGAAVLCALLLKRLRTE